MYIPSKHLILHGAVVLLYALLCGAPYGRAINRGAPERTIAAWRLAHSSLTIGALLMFVAGLLLPFFSIGAWLQWLIAISLIVSSYAFCVSLTAGPISGHRGLSPQGPAVAKLVYLGNLAGAAGALVASVGLLYAAAVSL